jgi:hypothetical protein
LTDKKQENQDNPSRDEVLKRMLKMKPKPRKPAPAGENSKAQNALRRAVDLEAAGRAFALDKSFYAGGSVTPVNSPSLSRSLS